MRLPSLSLCPRVSALFSRLTRPCSQPWCSRSVGCGCRRGEALKKLSICRRNDGSQLDAGRRKPKQRHTNSQNQNARVEARRGTELTEQTELWSHRRARRRSRDNPGRDSRWRRGSVNLCRRRPCCRAESPAAILARAKSFRFNLLGNLGPYFIIDSYIRLS